MTTILIKKKDTAGAPAAGDLTNAAGGTEIAVNTATKRVYTKDSGGTVVELGTNPSALTTNLLFSPDATYDIGASGASRPRDMFLSRNLTVGGTMTVTGGINFNGNVTVGDSSADTLTINSTITSNLIFTDNTYDIGVAGATRPRAGYFSGALVSQGQTVLTSSTTAAIFDFDNTTSEARLLGSKSTGSCVGVWTNSASGALTRRIYVDGIGRTSISSDTTGGGALAPQSWATSQSVLQLGGGGSWNASNTAGGTMSLTSNAYFDTSNAWLRRATGYAARIDALGTDGSVVLQTTNTSSTVGSTITWDNSLTLSRTNQLTLSTSSTAVNSSIIVNTLSTAGYSVLQLSNTGASGRSYQVGVGGASASPAGQYYIYDATAGVTAVRFAIDASGQVGIGTVSQTSLLHLYKNGSNVSITVQANGTSDSGIRTITTLADYKFGAGIGTASNAFTIYDIAASAQRFSLKGSGFVTIGTSTSDIAKLAVQVASSDGNLSDWGDGQFVVTRGADTRGNGLGISFNDADSSVYFSALQPATAWRNMKFRALGYQFLTTGATSALVIDNTYSQVVAPLRHSFYASGSQATAQPSGTTVIFPTLSVNVGSRYNNTNGVFTAAIAGTYQFNFTGTTFAVTNYFYGAFVINGVAQKAIWHLPVTSPDYMFICGSLTVNLSAGDTVSVVMSYNGGAPYLELGATGRNSFSGCLIG